MTVKVERCGSGSHHRQIHKTGNRHGDSHIPFGCGIAFFARPPVQVLG
ncbi:TPA: hypothetical protein OL743_002261 [Enterobacter cloacae]|nr:hypothetical protein [Enterobacter cloacae]HAV2194775.1 hypothetical protein [Enterobacter cloacae]HCQ7230228.1 hypothetical protein [Enterobacter cloacae]